MFVDAKTGVNSDLAIKNSSTTNINNRVLSLNKYDYERWFAKQTAQYNESQLLEAQKTAELTAKQEAKRRMHDDNKESESKKDDKKEESKEEKKEENKRDLDGSDSNKDEKSEQKKDEKKDEKSEEKKDDKKEDEKKEEKKEEDKRDLDGSDSKKGGEEVDDDDDSDDERRLSYMDKLYKHWPDSKNPRAQHPKDKHLKEPPKPVVIPVPKTETKKRNLSKMSNSRGGSYSDTKNYANFNPNQSYESKSAASNVFPNVPKNEFDEYIGRRLNNGVDEKDRRLNYTDRLYRTYETNVLKTNEKNADKDSDKPGTAKLNGDKRTLRNKYPGTSYEKKQKIRANQFAAQIQKRDNIAKNEKTKAPKPRKLNNYKKTQYEKILEVRRNQERTRETIRRNLLKKRNARKLRETDKKLIKLKAERDNKRAVRAAIAKKEQKDKTYKIVKRKLIEDKEFEKKTLLKTNKDKTKAELQKKKRTTYKRWEKESCRIESSCS